MGRDANKKLDSNRENLDTIFIRTET